ncbi:N-acyl-D-amino-acid deacylase family protein [Rhizorhabdus wittichii]|uniref:N-acyl-D-amino-acid deacylase family protein n=1 Tax=Rhizorhabdus wittichii TaxID=160791 RepID=UPI000305E029|nr:amidohydrolase family protein [Rhizorhabdus wittichii]
MSFDLLIRNGTVVDGTGAPRFDADVAVKDGRIAAIGAVAGDAARTIDAKGMIVAPGFVDPHTHYDAQMCWDPLLTPSSWHGVTTVVLGNCGVGVAPCRPGDRDKATWDLVNLEAIPYETLAQGLSWDWESFPDYMDAAERRGCGLNLAFLAPLAPFRRYVLGDEAMERPATAEETTRIRALLREAMAAGAVGFSSTQAPSHIGYQGKPLASVPASADELVAYAAELGAIGRGAIEMAIGSVAPWMKPADYELLDRMLEASRAPLTFLALMKFLDKPEAHLRAMEQVAPLVARGARPQMHSTNLVSDLNLRDPFMLSSFASLRGVFNQPREVQAAIYRDPAFRRAFRDEIAEQAAAFHGDWSMVWVIATGRADLERLIGRTLVEIGAERGQDPLDAFFDLALEDDLATAFTAVRFGVPEEFLGDPRTLIGLSDGGAHVGILCNAGYTTEMLGDLVRRRGLLDLETAVMRLTSDPADVFGLSDRGRLKPGLAADIVIFDPATVGSDSARPVPRDDLPGGARRLVVEAEGIRHVIVNGAILFEDGRHSGAYPGRVLRPGRASA